MQILKISKQNYKINILNDYLLLNFVKILMIRSFIYFNLFFIFKKLDNLLKIKRINKYAWQFYIHILKKIQSKNYIRNV